MSLINEITANFNLSEYGKLNIVGTTDEITTCFCCGKENLKRTAVMQDSDGNYAFFGTTCAHNASNKWTTSNKQKHKFKLPIELQIGRFNYRYSFELLGFECFNPSTKQWNTKGAKALQVMIEILENKSSLVSYDQSKLNFFLDRLEEFGHKLPF
jgi:hypothetical protein